MSRSYQRTFAFPVEFKNVPINKRVVNKKLNLKTIISASGWDLFTKKIKSRTVYIDLKEYPIQNAINFSNTKSLVSENFIDLKIIESSPTNFVLNLENLKTKKVAVKLNVEPNFSDNFHFNENSIISPDSLIISSDEKTLNTVEYIETESFIINETDTSRGNIKLIIPENIKANHTEVDAFFNIEEFAEKEFLVPVNIENKPSNTDLFFYPEMIKLKCLIPFTKYEKITASNFYISADFNNIEVSKDKIIVLSVKEKPKSVKNIQLEKEFVEYVLYSN